MKTITWDMAEQFTFPVGLGALEDVVMARVTPQWEQSEDGQSIRLTGIYHVAASVAFNPAESIQQVHGTYIEHIDIEQSTGYFEYALPLEVDLPAHKVTGPIDLKVQNLKAVHDGASCQLVWQVTCDFAEDKATVAVAESIAEVVQQIEEPPVAIVQEEVILQVEEPLTAKIQEEVAVQQEEVAIPVSHEAAEVVHHKESTSHLVSVHQEQVVAETSLQDDFLADLTETYSVLNVRSTRIE
ncbi:hypothetical protein [Metasolibacillus sp.]|uniref:hypothetical protein n=1 Tax=Metasolibacillus sp. TaxID=2703680 RepID=UPI0025E3E25A|nr:hypothetical protein [Metasolibacillus sp.]MCT6925460.1 hypothetical protein [Metasolibacillus sp.]MCT6941716.1 hypothetical protein [Metasolibacillus sp.]